MQLGHSWGLVSDMQKHLFISDFDNNRLCVLSDEGHLLGHIDLTEYQLEQPRGITIDTEGNLLVGCRIKMAPGADINAQVGCIVKLSYSIE